METFITVKKGFFKKRVGLRFDMTTYFYLMELHGIDINGGVVSDPEKFTYGLIHCAAIRFGEKHFKKIWFNEQDVSKWIPKIEHGEMEQLKKVIDKSSLVIQETAKNYSSKNEKKN